MRTRKGVDCPEVAGVESAGLDARDESELSSGEMAGCGKGDEDDGEGVLMRAAGMHYSIARSPCVD